MASNHIHIRRVHDPEFYERGHGVQHVQGPEQEQSNRRDLRRADYSRNRTRLSENSPLDKIKADLEVNLARLLETLRQKQIFDDTVVEFALVPVLMAEAGVRLVVDLRANDVEAVRRSTYVDNFGSLQGMFRFRLFTSDRRTLATGTVADALTLEASRTTETIIQLIIAAAVVDDSLGFDEDVLDEEDEEADDE
ncbi:hypothetical protein BDB00DRAFT_793470 [Zychaea mexicana]|uniref:uncharacterized protein n=1 Tax=Zychaea mexicana TaxID=64656 RepID=UPI0022FF385A|nr:uncharacterized protein BDB00DRAFT_793470 [Zychaea mexicana]KAI9474323.1 hypothetical protein BDB00DRAFT_793470 [Zychaea mexicana]